MKLGTYKNSLLNERFTFCINNFLPFGALANERQREIEYEAINLVIKKY